MGLYYPGIADGAVAELTGECLRAFSQIMRQVSFAPLTHWAHMVRHQKFFTQTRFPLVDKTWHCREALVVQLMHLSKLITYHGYFAPKDVWLSSTRVKAFLVIAPNWWNSLHISITAPQDIMPICRVYEAEMFHQAFE